MDYRYGSHTVYNTDFSVVLFRSDYMLVSEKNHMKSHKNQRVLTMPCPPELLAGATHRSQNIAPAAQKPSQEPYIACLLKMRGHNLLT
jgi:hypothetical protein